MTNQTTIVSLAHGYAGPEWSAVERRAAHGIIDALCLVTDPVDDIYTFTDLIEDRFTNLTKMKNRWTQT